MSKATYNKLWLLTALLCSLLADISLAESEDAHIYGRPSYRAFSDKNGLPQNSGMSMATDQNGFLWVATQYGAAYYNGRDWTTVNMPNHQHSNYVQTLMVASDGSIWFGTLDNGVCKLKNGTWTVFNKAMGALPGDHVWSILEVVRVGKESVLWIATQEGLARMQDGKWEHFTVGNSSLPANQVRSLLETHTAEGSSVIWVGTERGLVRIEGENWRVYTTENSPLPNWEVVALAPSIEGRHALWIGTEDGLARLEGDDWKVYQTSNSAIPHRAVYALLETFTPQKKKCLWVGTNGGGLARFEEGKWTTFNMTNVGLPSNNIRSLLETKYTNNSILWIGMNAGGVVQFEYGKWIKFDTRFGGIKHDNIRLLVESVENGVYSFWFCTYNGLTRYRNDQWTTFTTENSGIPVNFISSVLQTSDGRLLVGTWGGGLAVADYDGEPKRWKLFNTSNSALPDNRVTVLAELGAERRVYVGTTNGLMVLEGEKLKAFADVELSRTRIESMAETVDRQGRHTLWFGLYNRGLARYSDGQLQIYNNHNSDLPNDTVASLLVATESDGSSRLWVGTYGGLAILNPEDLTAKWTVLSDVTKPALPNNVVSQVRRDHRGKYYVCTFKGILRLSPRPEGGYDTYTFTVEDGLPGNGINPRAAIVDSKGRLWVGTLYGAAMLDPSREMEDRVNKPLVIEKVLVNSRLATSLMDLPYSDNNLSFDYVLVSFFKESETRYRYQLVGFDPKASDWTSEHKSVYTNLPEGEYTFQVWGRDYAGNITGPVSVAFSIRPAPWRTWWAYTLYAITLLGLSYGLFWIRISALRRQNFLLEAKVAERTAQLAERTEQLSEANRDLEAKVAERTYELSESGRRARLSEKAALEASRAKTVFLSNISHELRTPLNAILGYAQLMQRSKVCTGENLKNLESIISSGEHLLKLINDVILVTRTESGKILLEQVEFSLSELLSELKKSFDQKALLKYLEYSVTFQNLPKKVYGDRDKLYQVLYNLISNALKFTQHGRVTLSAEWLAGRCRFQLTDTGPGIRPEDLEVLFDPFVQSRSGPKSTDGLGLGLAISRKYVEAMGGELTVQTELGRGSIFSFEVPLMEVQDSSAPEDNSTESLELLSVQSQKGNEKTLLERLQKLDKIWVQELKRNLTIGDDIAALELVQKIRAEDELVADELDSLIRRFRFDTILEILERAQH